METSNQVSILGLHEHRRAAGTDILCCECRYCNALKEVGENLLYAVE